MFSLMHPHRGGVETLLFRSFTACWSAFIVALAIALPLPKLAAAQSRSASRQEQGGIDGRRTFVSNCAMCHGLDGRGGEHAPDIARAPAVQRLSDASLFEIIQHGIPAGGMPGFSSLGKPEIRAVLSYLRALQGNHGVQSVPGDPGRGRVLFFGAAGCSRCHMVNGQGGFLAADLSAYALSHSLPEVREAILDPDKNLKPREDTVVVVTRNGRKLVGIARNEDNFSLQLQTPDGVFHLFMKSDLAVVRHEARSLMPSDYGSRLSPRDLDDLISFLARTGEAPNSR